MAMAVGQTVTSDAISAQPSEQRSMLTRSDRLIQLPENVLSLSVSRRAWNGVRVDITESRCACRDEWRGHGVSSCRGSRWTGLR